MKLHLRYVASSFLLGKPCYTSSFFINLFIVSKSNSVCS